jgi:outer membrane receptor protein involved in Fe transport
MPSPQAPPDRGSTFAANSDRMKNWFFLLALILPSFSLFAGTGTITGRVIDEKGEVLIGASVLLEGTTTGVKTDLDGRFTLRNLEDGKYSIVISYVSYEKKIITGVEVKGGQCEPLTVTLLRAGKGLKEVVVKTQMKKESINALQIQQKNLTTISDGISGEVIRKTPDRNTGDVLKRVSGVSIADNKFAVIRGLADRYNLAMLNGDMLPSSEADRKAFSFDIFPSSLLDNIVIVKAATPDRPAEFAGGIIDLSTRDIPAENFLNLQIGSGMNTVSTFRPYADSKNSSTDWLGYDKSMRVLPNDFPTKETLNQSLSQFTLNDRIEASKKFENTWGVKRSNSMSPFRNAQLGGGWRKNIGREGQLGVLGAVSYSRTFRTFQVDRNEVNGNTEAYRFKDTVHRDNVLIGSLLNIGYKINNNHKITFKNAFTINSDDQTVLRGGDFKDNEYYVKGSALWFSNNQLLSNQLSSDHVLTKRKIRLQLGAGRNRIVRTIPDLRRSYYTRNYDAQDSTFTGNVTTFPNPFFMGRFFARTEETIYSGSADLTVPYRLLGGNHSLKAGFYQQNKERSYNARVLAYVKAKAAGFQNNLLTLPEEQMFSEENIKSNGFILADATLPQDQYTATSTLRAAYLMTDQLFAEKFRFVYGVRMEQFSQQLLTGVLQPGDLTISKSNTNFLPSLNFTYLLNKKTNLRLGASQTLSRPEFRELSPSSFYDYNMSATYTGNPDLEQTRISNLDLRYEYFMGKGEMISGSVFYKHFTNPIETSVPKGFTTTQKVFSYMNVPTAQSMGIELEFRKSMGFLSSKESSAWQDLVFFGNLAYIRSEVNVTTKNAGGETVNYVRPMQGQSPYILNGGLSYSLPKYGFAATAVYNRIGERIFAVGNGEIPELYEAPRNVLDLSLSKKFLKKGEVKFTVSDIFSNPQRFYYNIDQNYRIVEGQHRFQQGKDYEAIVIRPGTNIGLSVNWQL